MHPSLVIAVASWLVLANFAYQLFGGQDWMLALERSWFQLNACLALALADYAVRRSVGAP